MDDQVKINGFRVELGEIEEVLRGLDGISNAVVAIRPRKGQAHLIAYIVFDLDKNGDLPSLTDIKKELEAELPGYMVPSLIEILDNLPTMVSGKIDRKALPEPRWPEVAHDNVETLNPLQLRIHEVWSEVLEEDRIPLDADFFTMLGGHSLRVAEVVSLLRHMPAFERVAMGDIYAYPTLRQFCAYLEESTNTSSEDAPKNNPAHRRGRVSNSRHIAMGCVQILFLTIYLGIFFSPMGLLIHAIDWDIPPWEGLEALKADIRAPSLATTPFESALIHPCWILILAPIMLIHGFLLPVLVKWTVIRRLKPGRYPLWGGTYFRWWVGRRMLLITPDNLLAGTPFLNRYLNLLGAKVAPSVYLASPQVECPDLVEIGSGAMIGYQASIQPYQISQGWLELGPIKIGANASIGAKSKVILDSRMGRGSVLGVLSLLNRGDHIPDSHYWSGSPAQERKDPEDIDRSIPAKPIRWKLSHQLWQVLGILILFAIPYSCSISTLYLVSGLLDSWGLAGTPLIVVMAGSFFTLQMCFLISFNKTLLPRLKPGIYPVASRFGVAKWLSDKLVEMSLFFLNPLYSTLYTPLWLRFLGAKVGPRAEISTVSDIDPDLLTLDEECFVADMAAVGPAGFYRGYFQIAETYIGRRSFVGNAALVPANTRMENETLLGVCSTPHSHFMARGTSWLGSPAIYLPRREIMEMSDDVTYTPSKIQIVIRLIIELFRVTIPPGLLIFATGVVLDFYESEYFADWGGEALLAYEMLLMLEALSLALVVLIIKWLLIGRYRPRTEPNWSLFVRRTEFVTALYENIPVPLILDWLQGTPWISLVLRLFGVKIGRRVFLDSTFITEFDLVHIGDDCHVGFETSLQTHLFEDRVMKMSTLRLEPLSGVGSHSVVLYDSMIEKGAEVTDFSLVMKGESIPEGSRWTGLPARAI